MKYECMYLHLHIFFKAGLTVKLRISHREGGNKIGEQRYKVELLACICFVDLARNHVNWVL